MLKNLRKKGFTIVELVIVIAVIAILAAILIPTFSGIIKKANIASDTALAKNMNTALVMADSEGNVPEDMGDVLYILFEAGYVLENLNPTTNGYYFAWDQPKNQIIFLTDTFEVHYSSEAYSEDTLNWWLPIDEASDVTEIEAIGAKFSYCMAADIAGSFTFDYLANFDTNGFYLDGNLTYDSTDAGEFTVSGMINGALNVNAPNANVSHYGAVENVNIVKVSRTSYHEYGFVKVSLELQEGRLVIENTGNATEVILPVSENGTAENKGYIGTLSGKTAGENVPLNNSGYVKTMGDNGSIDSSSTKPETGAPTGFAILIENLNQLEAFRDAVNAGMTCDGLTVKLMADIDISNRYWKPIGYNNKVLDLRTTYEESFVPHNVFMGTFDGNNKTIKGLSNYGYNAPAATFWTNASNITGYLYGLFSVTYDAEIKNLNLTDVNIVLTDDPSACVGSFVGAVRGSFTLDNCSVKGNIEGSDGVGGAAGYVYLVEEDKGKTVNINNVSVEANVHGTIQRVGGILGTTLIKNLFKDDKSNNFFMRGCSFKGSVTLSELPKDDPLVNTKNARVAGLFAASNSGGWLPGAAADFENITVQDFEVANNTVEGIISGPRSVARFFCFHSSGYTHVYNETINASLATYVHDNTFVEGGDVRGKLSSDTPIISLINHLGTLGYVPVN